MGILRSMADHSTLVVKGVTLGVGARDTDKNGNPVGEYRWDHPRLPNGAISDSGEITLDEVDE
jgi:hypothetical protein